MNLLHANIGQPDRAHLPSIRVNGQENLPIDQRHGSIGKQTRHPIIIGHVALEDEGGTSDQIHDQPNHSDDEE